MATVGSAADAAQTCDGQKATIVGSPSIYRLKGTRGDDVIVSNGRESVYGFRGDDVICLTNGSKNLSYYAAGGDGDDRIYVQFPRGSRGRRRSRQRLRHLRRWAPPTM